MSGLLCACFWSPHPKIPEEYLRPQGLYSLERVDLKKLKRLIRNQQLAPCHPGVEDSVPGQDLEECPICFLHYPVLNSSLCCHKRVCTECFLQVQTSTPPHQLSSCPFCKVTRPTGYLVKLIGARTAEEKEQERVEEQKVIEARIREREEELRRDQERALQRQQQQQQQAAGAATAGTNRACPANTATTADNGGINVQQQQQQPSAGVIAAAAAASSSLEPSGGPNAGAAAVGRAAGRGSGTAALSGAQDAGRYQGNDRHRYSTAAMAATATTGAASATVVQMGGGAGRGVGGAGPYPLARRAAAVAAMSAVLQHQHQQSGHRVHNYHHNQHTDDRHVAGSEAGAGAQPEGPGSGGAGGGGSGHPRRHPGGGGGLRYRLTDYVPAGVVDIAMGLDDINDFMLVQAMYESLADVAGASPPAQAQSAAAPAATTATGGDGAVADADNDADLAAALAASLRSDGGAGAPAAQHSLSPRAPSLAITATTGGPAGRSGWRQASATSGSSAATLTHSAGGDDTGVDLRARPVAAAAGTLQAAQGSRIQLPQAKPSRRRSAAAVAAAARRDDRPGTPDPQPRAWATPPTACPPASRDRRRACDLHGRAEEEVEEQEEEDSLMSRRTAPPVQSASGDHERPASVGSASAASPQLLRAPAPQKAEAAAAPAVDSAVLQSPGLSGQGLAPSASLPTQSSTQRPGGSSPAADRADGAAAVAAPAGAVRAPTSFGAQTPSSLSPVPSESPVGALAAASDFSSAATGGGGARDDLLDAVSGGGGVSGGGACGAGEQHVTNPLYDIWSNSSSATMATYKIGSDPPPGPVAAAVAGDQEDVAASGRPVGGPVAVSARWDVKAASQRSSMGSDRGVAPQYQGSEGSPAAVIPTSPPALQEQHHTSPSLPADMSRTADCVAAQGRPQPLTPPPPQPPLATATPATPTSPPACTSGGGGELTMPSPRLGLPPMDVSVLAAGVPHPADGAPAEEGPSTLQQGATVVTIQTLASELLRHGNGPVRSGAGTGDAPCVMTVGMVFQAPSRGAGGDACQATATAATLEGPALVENPDGSLQMLLPAGGLALGRGAAASQPPPQRHRRCVGGNVATSDDVMEVPYMDYELSELQPLPSLASPTGLDLPPDAPYIADGGNEPAPVAIEGMDPAAVEVAEAADEAVRRLCGEADVEVMRFAAAQDAAITAAIAARNRGTRSSDANNDADGSTATGKDKGVR